LAEHGRHGLVHRSRFILRFPTRRDAQLSKACERRQVAFLAPRCQRYGTGVLTGSPTTLMPIEFAACNSAPNMPT
jgi:hypothetical protein